MSRQEILDRFRIPTRPGGAREPRGGRVSP